MKNNKPNELGYNAYAYWWNFGKKQKDYSGNLEGLLKDKGIKYRKVKHHEKKEIEGYKFTINNRITFVSYNDFFDGAFTALKLFYAYMGDKATVNVIGRTFTINH